jgi:hypothetical protein
MFRILEWSSRLFIASGQHTSSMVDSRSVLDSEFFEGRSCYFADPEENFWEVAWAPPDNPIVAAARRAARADGSAQPSEERRAER